MTSRFEVKKPERWEVKKDHLTQPTRPGLSRAIFNRAMHEAKRISSERELRRLKWNI